MPDVLHFEEHCQKHRCQFFTKNIDVDVFSQKHRMLEKKAQRFVKNIANLHCEHNVLIFFKHCHLGRWFCQKHRQSIASLRKINITHP